MDDDIKPLFFFLTKDEIKLVIDRLKKVGGSWEEAFMKLIKENTDGNN